jgi:hypothetical protein
MTSIAPGGCYPPHWPAPPTCWPPGPLPPEPDPESLDAVVDWMTYSHPELHRMVHDGLDLTGAMEVSARWARLGEELAELGEVLGEIVTRSAAAWEGEAADLTRQTLAGLTHWGEDTGAQATKVSACVTIEVDNATNARDEMPAPPTDLPTPQPKPLFTTNDWTAAAAMTADPAGPLAREKALHEQAARTMERFQESSREVYGTVPRFSPPQVGSPLVTLPESPPVPSPHPPQPTIPQAPAVPRPPAPPGSSGSPTAPGAPERSVMPPAPAPTPGTTEPPAEPRPAAAAAAPPPGPAGRSGQPGIGGGMPMPGAGGAGDGEDVERKNPGYLKEDEDIWGLYETPTIPPVIGEDRRHA